MYQGGGGVVRMDTVYHYYAGREITSTAGGHCTYYKHTTAESRNNAIHGMHLLSWESERAKINE